MTGEFQTSILIMKLWAMMLLTVSSNLVSDSHFSKFEASANLTLLEVYVKHNNEEIVFSDEGKVKTMFSVNKPEIACIPASTF
jgi:hypothetical protein